jgi:hypothetical protein
VYSRGSRRRAPFSDLISIPRTWKLMGMVSLRQEPVEAATGASEVGYLEFLAGRGRIAARILAVGMRRFSKGMSDT